MAILAVDELMLREPRLLVPKRLPLRPPKIDWQNPITRDLVICFLPGMLYEAVSGQVGGGYESSGSRLATVEGMGCESTSTATGGAWFPYQPSWQKLAATNKHTLLFRGRIDVATGWGKLLSIPYSTSEWSSPYHSIALGSTGYAYFYENIGGSQVLTSRAASAPWTSGSEVKNFIGRRDSTFVDWFCDRYYEGGETYGSSGNPIITVDAAVSIQSRSHYAASDEGNDGHATMGCMWARALTDAEICSLAADPYQFLIPA